MKKLFIFLLLGIFIISFVNAAEWDNVQSYNPETKTYLIENMLGFGETLAEIKLISGLNVLVPVGYQKVAEFELYSFKKDDSIGLQSMNFYEANDISKELIRTFDYKYLDYQLEEQLVYGEVCGIEKDNGTVCRQQEIGLKNVSKPIWIEFNDISELPSGKDSFTIGIFTNVKKDDRVEWIPTFFGERLTEWAVWTESLSAGLASYYKLDELSGSTAFDEREINNLTNTGVVANQTGKINKSYLFNTNNDNLLKNSPTRIGTGSFSGSMWVNLTDADVVDTLINIRDVSPNTDFQIRFNDSTTQLAISVYDGVEGIDITDFSPYFNNWTNIVFVVTSSNIQLWINGVIKINKSVSFTLFTNTDFLMIGNNQQDITRSPNGFMDEIGIWNRTLSESEILQLYNGGDGITFTESFVPGIILNSPIDTFNSTTQTINFNGTVESPSPFAVINVSLILDGIFNETNTSGINNIDYLFTKVISDGSHNWTYESCNANGCIIATVRTFTIDTVSPKINISAPSGILGFNSIGSNETLNVTFTDSNLDSCWYNYNGVNITIEGCISGVLNSTQFILEEENLNLTVYSNDTTGNENSSFINWSYLYLENNRTLNNESFQTASETFNINVEGPTSVSLFYNGTEYTTTKSGNDFTRTIQIPIVNLGNNLVYWRFDDTQNSFNSSQNISETVFTSCLNQSHSTTFLNISFKDETNLSVISASIPTSTFTYWLGDGTVTKTFTLINNTDNFNYEFCATPNRTFNINSVIQYKQGSLYPQRIFSQTAATLTNITTNLTLYLLGVSDGLFVTFQVLNVAEQPISEVEVSGTRILEGSDTLVAQGTTDAAGSVTFWLNPDFLHTLTFTKTGFDTLIKLLFPTQSSYTISLGGGLVTEPDQTRGVSLVVKPQISFLVNDTIYNFNYTISSTFWNLDEFGFTLFYSNGTEIGTETSTDTGGGVLSLNANTLNSSSIRMDYYYLINETYTNTTRIWFTQNTEGTEYSISNFFQRVTTYTTAGLFGFDDFGKALISFLILVLVSGGLSFRYGLQSEVAIMGIIFGLVLVLDVGLGLIPNPQLATESGIENVITVITGILLFGILVREELR